MTTRFASTIAHNADRTRFEILLDRGAAAIRAGKDINAAAWLQLAAMSAWVGHPGFFHSRLAEDLLADLSARNVVTDVGGKLSGSSQNERVLHVLTQAYQVGGHTRLAWRWIEADQGRTHSVALTQQAGLVIPQQLVRAVQRSGGKLTALEQGHTLFETARALRRMASEVDLIVLHVHPNDIVPSLAWGGSEDHAPIIFLNHADHVFWIGAALCDVNVNIRASGLRLSVTRRGIPLWRNLVLPLPLQNSTSRQRRLTARRSLGLSDDDIVAISIASGYKFAPTLGADFVQLHLPVLNDEVRLKILVIGADPRDPYWIRAADVTHGRIIALSVRNDVETFHAAADIYLDSLPFGSLTSLLEAAQSGLPCVSWRPYAEGSQSAVLSCDDVALDQFPVAYTDPHAYFDKLRSLTRDPSAAASLGMELAAAVNNEHTGISWLRRLEQVYLVAAREAACRRNRTQLPVGVMEGYDEVLSEFQVSARRNFSPSRSLPLGVRLRFLRLNHASTKRLISELLPLSSLNFALRNKRKAAQLFAFVSASLRRSSAGS